MIRRRLHRLFRAVALNPVVFWFLLLLGALQYFLLLGGYLVSIVTNEPITHAIDDFDIDVIITASGIWFVLAVFATFYWVRPIRKLAQESLYRFSIGVATGILTCCAAIILGELFNFLNYLFEVFEDQPTRWVCFFSLVLFLMAPRLVRSSIRRAHQRIPFETEPFPSSPALSLHFTELRRGALIISTAVCSIIVAEISITLLPDAIARQEGTKAFPPDSDPYLILKVLLCVPAIGFLVYRHVLKRSGVVLWLRPFHYQRHFKLDRLIKKACAGIANSVTLQDSTIKRSLLAGVSSRWVFASFVIPIWLFGLFFVLTATGGFVYYSNRTATDETVSARFSDNMFLIKVPLSKGNVTDEKFDALLLHGISITFPLWTCLFFGFAYWYLKRYSFTRLSESSEALKTVSIINDLGSGHIFGGGLHVLACPSSRWRSVVSYVIGRADVVIADVTSLSDNIIWEISEALEHLPPRQVVLIYYSVDGRNEFPADALSKLKRETRSNVDECVLLVFNSGAYGKPEEQIAGLQLRLVIERARFQREASRFNTHTAPEDSFSEIRGWLRLPILELLISAAAAASGIIFNSLMLLGLHYDYLDFGDIRKLAPTIPPAAIMFSFWARLSCQILELVYALLLMNLAWRRRKIFIRMMIIWFVGRIALMLLYTTFISFRFLRFNLSDYLAYWLPFSVWAAMYIYMVRSHRVRMTFVR